MNTENTSQTEPVGKPALQSPLEQHEVPEVLDFLKENGVAIVIGVIIAVGAFVGYSSWKDSKAAKQETASNLLATSQTAPQFQEIITNYGDTPAAAIAYLSLAGAYFDEGQYDLARHNFSQFQKLYPKHDLLPNAELGIAQSLESAGSLPEALAAYDAFLVAHGSHYMMPAAVFGKGRVLEIMGRFDDARTVYEDFIAAHPESRWALRAETGLDFVKKQQRAAQAVQVAPAP